MASGATDGQQQQLRRTRLRILPGSTLLGIHGDDPPLHPPPPPPSSPPPDPTEIIRIVVLGDRNVGKSSIVAKFVGREYCVPSKKHDGAGHADDNKSVRSGKSVRSSRSAKSGTSRRSAKSSSSRAGRSSRHNRDKSSSSSRHHHHHHHQEDDTSGIASVSSRKQEGIQLIKAEYHRKDLTIWMRIANNQDSGMIKQRGSLRRISEHGARSATADSDVVDENNTNKGFEAICSRVQVWDTQGNTNMSEKTMADASKDKRWVQIFKNVSGVVIVCTLDDNEGEANLDRQAVMEHLERQICRWLSLVDVFVSDDDAIATGPKNTKTRIPITLVLNKSDQISLLLSSSNWVRLGAQMERMCERLGITGGWYTSTCIEPKISPPQDRGVSSGSWDEDHDGAELAFLSLVRASLLKKNNRQEVELDMLQRKENDQPGAGARTMGHKEEGRNRRRRKKKGGSSLPQNAPKFPIDP